MEMQVESVKSSQHNQKIMDLYFCLASLLIAVFVLSYWVDSKFLQIVLGVEGMGRLQWLEVFKGLPGIALIAWVGSILILAFKPRHTWPVLVVWIVSSLTWAMHALAIPEMSIESQQGYEVLKLTYQQIVYCNIHVIVFSIWIYKDAVYGEKADSVKNT